MRVRDFASCVVLVSLFGAAQAQAQANPSAPAASLPSPPLALLVDLGDSKLDAEAIRSALELELKRPVTLVKDSASASAPNAQSLTVRLQANHTVSVSYREATGLTRTRVIGLPQDHARSAEVIALLAGNLSRDEATELLAELAAKSKPPTTKACSDTLAGRETPARDASQPPEQKPKAAQEPTTPAQQPAPPAKEQSAQSTLRMPRPAFNLSLFAPISLYPHGERLVLNGELGLAYSRVGELRGAGLNVFALRTEQDVHGASLATMYNRTGGTVHGASIAAIVNLAQGVEGTQLSGIMNRAGRVHGAQVAGISNSAREVSGVQVGLANFAHEISGLQLGLVNFAEEVHGTQLGLVNIAKHVDGTSLGLVSIAGNGRVQPVLWASTFTPLNAAVKFSVGAFYTQAGLGYEFANHTYDWELGLGAHLRIRDYFIDPGMHYSEQRDISRSFEHELLEHLHYRIAVGRDLGAVSPFVGASVVQRFAHASDAPKSVPVTVEGFAGLAFL